jgi:hypothetical protein
MSYSMKPRVYVYSIDIFIWDLFSFYYYGTLGVIAEPAFRQSIDFFFKSNPLKIKWIYMYMLSLYQYWNFALWRQLQNIWKSSTFYKSIKKILGLMSTIFHFFSLVLLTFFQCKNFKSEVFFFRSGIKDIPENNV